MLSINKMLIARIDISCCRSAALMKNSAQSPKSAKKNIRWSVHQISFGASGKGGGASRSSFGCISEFLCKIRICMLNKAVKTKKYVQALVELYDYRILRAPYARRAVIELRVLASPTYPPIILLLALSCLLRYTASRWIDISQTPSP